MAGNHNREPQALRRHAGLSGGVLVVLGLALLLVAAVAMRWVWEREQAGARELEAASAAVMAHVEERRAAGEGGVAADADRSSQAVMETWTAGDGRTYVAVLEVMSEGISLPVLAEVDLDQLGLFPCRHSGSCFANTLVVWVFEDAPHAVDLRSLALGTEVQLTTMDGITFLYGLTDADSSGDSAQGDLTLVLVGEDAELVASVACTAVH